MNCPRQDFALEPGLDRGNIRDGLALDSMNCDASDTDRFRLQTVALPCSLARAEIATFYQNGAPSTKVHAVNKAKVQMRNIVVLGSGLGGYHAARLLESNLLSRRRVQLTVVSDRAHMLFSPLLYSVATGELDVPHIAVDLVNEYAPSTDLLITQVSSLDTRRRVLICEDDVELPFDYLLLATGSVVDLEGHPHWLDHLFTFKDAKDAMAIREHLEKKLEASAELVGDPLALAKCLKIVIIGAGAAGVELAAELSSAVHERLTSADERIRAAFSVVLIEAQGEVLPRHGPEVQTVARTQLVSLGAEVRVGTRVEEVLDGRVELSDGDRLDADTIIYCGGVRATALFAETGFETDALGRVRVDQTLQVKGHQGIYAIGAGSVLDDPLPMEADVARQQAELAAQNLLAELSGRMRREFKLEPTGDLITLGRDNAALSIRGVALEGKAAWLMYRLFYTATMPRALKKARLFKDWVANRTNKKQRRPDPPLLEEAPKISTLPTEQDL